MIEIEENYFINKLDYLISNNKAAFCDDKITDKQILNNVFKHLNIDNIICILLRGSFAQKRDNPYSDVDVVVIQKIVDKDSISFCDCKGRRYHLNIFDESFLISSYDKHIYRFYYGMKKIYDPYNVCDKLINDIKEYEVFNCSKIAKMNPEGKDYLYRLLEYVDSDDEILSIFVKAKILKESPAFLANYNGFNLIGFKTTIDCLIRDNYNLALIYGKALDKKSGKKELKEWLEAAFNGLCGIDVLNLDFSKSKKSHEVFINENSMYDLYNDYYYFIDYFRRLAPENTNLIDFYLDCANKYPKLFNKLRNLFKI